MRQMSIYHTWKSCEAGSDGLPINTFKRVRKALLHQPSEESPHVLLILYVKPKIEPPSPVKVGMLAVL